MAAVYSATPKSLMTSMYGRARNRVSARAEWASFMNNAISTVASR